MNERTAFVCIISNEILRSVLQSCTHKKVVDYHMLKSRIYLTPTKDDRAPKLLTEAMSNEQNKY